MALLASLCDLHKKKENSITLSSCQIIVNGIIFEISRWSKLAFLHRIKDGEKVSLSDIPLFPTGVRGGSRKKGGRGPQL